MIERNERDAHGRFHVPTQDEDFDAVGAAQHAVIRRVGSEGRLCQPRRLRGARAASRSASARATQGTAAVIRVEVDLGRHGIQKGHVVYYDSCQGALVRLDDGSVAKVGAARLRLL